jgi:hypothetical protein
LQGTVRAVPVALGLAPASDAPLVVEVGVTELAGRFLDDVSPAAIAHGAIPRDVAWRSKGCAFVRLENADDAARVVAALDGQVFQAVLRVFLARP